MEPTLRARKRNNWAATKQLSSRELGAQRVRNRATTIRRARIDVHRARAYRPAQVPSCVVLKRSFPTQLQLVKRAGVAYARAYECTVAAGGCCSSLRHSSGGCCKLGEKAGAVLNNCVLLGLCVPLADLQDIANLPSVKPAWYRESRGSSMTFCFPCQFTVNNGR